MNCPRPMIRLRSPSLSEAAPGKSGAAGDDQEIVEIPGVGEVGVGVVAAEIRQGPSR